MKTKISAYVVLKKEPNDSISGYCWRAYFRGTSNRVKRETGQIVFPYSRISDLRFDLLNNPMERGVIA